MLLTIDPSKAEQLIESPVVVREDDVIPSKFPEHPNCTYRQGYDWLFIYERDIAKFLEKWLKPYRYELIGSKGILCEALSNSFSHAHNKNPDLPMHVKVLLGNKGLIVRVADSGKGFNVNDVYTNFCNNKKYYYTAGNGMRRMSSSERFGIFHNKDGNVFHLLYLFSGKLEDVPADTILTPQFQSTDCSVSSTVF